MNHLFPIIDDVLDFNFPVEIWSMVLRILDPGSLVVAVRTNLFWMRVARGDPTLRQRIRKEVRRQEEIRQQEMLNPGSMMAVIREGPTTLFQTFNRPKKIEWRLSRSSSFMKDKQRNGGGKILRTKSARPGPLS